MIDSLYFGWLILISSAEVFDIKGLIAKQKCMKTSHSLELKSSHYVCQPTRLNRGIVRAGYIMYLFTKSTIKYLLGFRARSLHCLDRSARSGITGDNESGRGNSNRTLTLSCCTPI